MGPYSITAKLGEGGMGEVWRARDVHLGREVALKLLPSGLASDPDRLARFEREAKLLAQLNHPNIAQIYGLEVQGATRALVMELVEGPTLAERLEAGALPFGESLSFALQIAQALEEAHEKGIVHRDLKPQNIKASLEGRVKVLDFGLAKAMDPSAAASGGAASASQLAQSPTLTIGATVQGLILGTAAYMAPEQARGVAVDKRADIWAFGVVLFEMLTGRRLFEGELVTDVLAGVLKNPIDLDALPAGTPPAIRRLIRRCLERNPRNRLHDIADARLVLEEVAAGGDAADGAPAAAPPRPVRTAAWLGVLALAAGLAGGLGWLAGQPAPKPVDRLQVAVQLAPDQKLEIGGSSRMTFSPDGRSLVFRAAGADGRTGLFRRELGEREAAMIPGTENGGSPAFSSDGEWIVFEANERLMKIAAAGGRAFRVADARGAGGAAFLPDGTIVFAPIYSDGLFRLVSESGTPERLTTPEREEGVLGHWWPEPLPDGQHVLFTAFRTPVERSWIGVLDLETRATRRLVEGGFSPAFVAPDLVVYAAGDGRLFALPFDARRAVATGPARPVHDDVFVSQSSGFGGFAVSSRGALAYIASSVALPARELVWLDRDGGASPAVAERRPYLSARLSPDGLRAALALAGASHDLWVLDLERGVLSRRTSGGETEFDPIWSRDGRELLYVVDRPPFDLFRIATESAEAGRPLWPEPATGDTTNPALSPDGRTLVYTVVEEGTGGNLYARALDGGEPARPFRATRAEEQQATFSPDGRWLAYESNETGRPEIYAEAFPGPGERVQVSADGGSTPLWARNGEIFFRRDDEIRVVATRSGSRLEVDPPRTLFRFPVAWGRGAEARVFDVDAEGQRILAITIPDASRPRRIDLVLDWAAGLERDGAGGRP